MTGFSPRSHEGSDGVLTGNPDGGVVFQSTLPRGERLKSQVKYSIYGQFQSTLPRGERLQLLLNLLIRQFVSIHAPTMGATLPGR